MSEPAKHADFASRLRWLIHDKLEMNPRRFALEAKATPQTIHRLLGGEFLPSAKTLQMISGRWPNLNTDWLIYGRGEAFPAGVYSERPTPAEAPSLPPARQSHLTAERGDLFDVVPRSTYDEVVRQREWLQAQYDKLLEQVLLGKPLDEPQSARELDPAQMQVTHRQVAGLRRYEPAMMWVSATRAASLLAG